MFCPAESWPVVHRGLTRNIPQPPEIANETPEVLESYVARIQQGFQVLRAELVAAQPDVLLIVGDDQTEVFSKAFTPAVALFVGASASGTASISWIDQKPEDNRVALRGQPALARVVLDGLMDRGFDPAFIEELTPLGKPAGGLGHAFTRIARALGVPELDLPTIPLFLNGYHPPMPSAARCYALGAALAEILAAQPERVTIYASGGLSHDPLGKRAGWVDEPLDRWVLDRIQNGEGEKLQHLFAFDSDTLRGGTGEIRSWITVAGAFHAQNGTVVDYIPARHAVTGLGFAYWRPEA
jgi:protocatechuate 4,5-dioxygenase beta chain